MTRVFGSASYTTACDRSLTEGWAAVELRCSGVSEPVARVVFWDAQGQVFLEMLVPELPVELVDALIAEAKSSIRIR